MYYMKPYISSKDCLSLFFIYMYTFTQCCFCTLPFGSLFHLMWVYNSVLLPSWFSLVLLSWFLGLMYISCKLCFRCTFSDHVVELSKDNSENSLSKDAYLIICESIALKMLSNANLFLVSVDLPLASKLDDASGLCLRFSAEILSTSVPCLITITVEGACSEPLNMLVKVNCEETVFGLNLLNRVVNFLAEPLSSCS